MGGPFNCSLSPPRRRLSDRERARKHGRQRERKRGGERGRSRLWLHTLRLFDLAVLFVDIFLSLLEKKRIEKESLAALLLDVGASLKSVSSERAAALVTAAAATPTPISKSAAEAPFQLFNAVRKQIKGAHAEERKEKYRHFMSPRRGEDKGRRGSADGAIPGECHL